MTQPYHVGCECCGPNPGGPCPQANTCCDCCSSFTVVFTAIIANDPTFGQLTYDCGSIVIAKQGGAACVCLWGGFGGSTLCYPNGGLQVAPLQGSIQCVSPGIWRLSLTTFGGVNITYEVPSSACPPTGEWHRVNASANVLQSPAAVALSCEDDPPPPPPPPPTDLGACCTTDNQCSDRTKAQCDAVGGTWYGAGSTCASTNCGTPPEPLGACCLPNGLCMNMTHATCNLHGGQWFPLPATCETHQCQFGEGIASRGFGDTIAKFTKAIGVKPCARCSKRQELLNRVFPYQH